jgi:hypothetical protein
MAITVTQVNSTSDTFNVWLTTTNQMANLMSTAVVTANSNANGSLTTGNAHVNGIMSSVTMATTTLRGGNVQSSGLLTISTNVQVSDTQIILGNSTVNVVANTIAFTLANSTVSYSLIKPTASQKAGTTFYLNANGSWSNPFNASISVNGTVTATAFRSGTGTANAVLSNTSLAITNSTVSFTLGIPTSAQVSDGGYYLNANGNWVDIFAGAITFDSEVTATGFRSGTGTTNTSLSNTALTLSNSTVSFSLIKPTTSQVSDGDFYFNANGSWVDIFARSETFTGTVTGSSGLKAGTSATSNITISNTGITFANSTVSSFTMIQPTTAEQDGAHYLNGNGAWVAIFEIDPVIEGNVTADTFTAGGSSTNVFINATSITIANTTTSFTILNPTTSQVSDGDFFLNANGSWVDIWSPAATFDSSVTATSFRSGTGTANAVLSNTTLTISNSTVTFTLGKPTAAQQSAGDTFLNADGTWDAIGTSNSSGFKITGNLYATDDRIWANNVMVDGILRGGNATISEVLNISSNVAVTGTKISVGTGSTNTQLTTTTLTLANSTVTFILDKPTAAEISAGDRYLNANGEWASLATATLANAETSGTGAQIIDSWASASYWAAEYTIVTNDNNANNRQTSRMMLMHNGDALLTEYAVLISNNDMGVYSANVNSGTVRLWFQPVSSNTSVFIKKEYVPV